jgi:hypothetical protein
MYVRMYVCMIHTYVCVCVCVVSCASLVHFRLSLDPSFLQLAFLPVWAVRLASAMYSHNTNTNTNTNTHTHTHVRRVSHRGLCRVPSVFPQPHPGNPAPHPGSVSGFFVCQHEMGRLAELHLAQQRLRFALVSWGRALHSEQRAMHLWVRQVDPPLSPPPPLSTHTSRHPSARMRTTLALGLRRVMMLMMIR